MLSDSFDPSTVSSKSRAFPANIVCCPRETDNEENEAILRHYDFEGDNPTSGDLRARLKSPALELK